MLSAKTVGILRQALRKELAAANNEIFFWKHEKLAYSVVGEIYPLDRRLYLKADRMLLKSKAHKVRIENAIREVKSHAETGKYPLWG